MSSADFMGSVKINVASLRDGQPLRQWYHLRDKPSGEAKGSGDTGGVGEGVDKGGGGSGMGVSVSAGSAGLLLSI